MRKCPNCAEENNFESLFCKQCGHCLLAPDPERIQWSITHPQEPILPPEPPKTPERMVFIEDTIANLPIITKPKRRFQIEPSVAISWLLVLNVLVLIIMYEIARRFLA